MDLIFSTPLGVYTFCCESGVLRCLRIDTPEFYGISATRNGLVLSHTGIDNARLTSHASYVVSERGRVREYGELSTTESAAELLQPHQVESYGDSILVANSGRNCITAFNEERSAVHYFPTTARWDIGPAERKANHFNSVHVEAGLVYVVAHNYQRLSTVWVFTWPGFDLVDVIGTNTVWAHNVMVRGQDLVVCNSASGSLYSIEEKRDIWSVDGGGFITRGLASASGLLFAGLSAVAGRGDRKDCDAAICVVDLDTMRTIERFDFPRLGGIHEIRLLDIADTCHGGPVIRVPHRLLEQESAASAASNSQCYA